MDSSWKRLPLLVPQSRPLLYKAKFALDSYQLCITDLEHIWIEGLARRDVIRKALDLYTSIDPSEGSEQLRLLLQHLSNILEGKPGTSLSVETTSDDCMHIVATAELPGSLPLLTWNFSPRISSQASLTDEFVRPTLQSIVHLKSQTSSLMGELKDKDRVIRKLLIKLESSGIELTSIFPNVQPRGSKASTQEAILKAVRGLGEFNENSWRESLSQDVVSSLEEILDAALPYEGSSSPRSKLASRHAPNDSTKIASKPVQDTPPSIAMEKNEPVTKDSLLQKQFTPRENRDHLVTPAVSSDIKARDSHIHQSKLASDDTATEDSDDSGARIKPVKLPPGLAFRSQLPSSSESESKAQTLGKGKKKLGIIGGRKPATSSSEEDDAPTIKAPNSRKAKRFGKIGGKAVSSSSSDQESHRSNKSVSPLPPRSPKKPPGEPSTAVPSVSHHGLQPESSKTRGQSQNVQETPEERALRKRQEVKEIESKKAPAKKKRKF